MFKSLGVQDMIYPRAWHSLCKDGRYLFATGSTGFNRGKNRLGNDFESSYTVEVYDPLNDYWQYMPNLNVGRYRHASCCMDDILYVFCGQHID